MIAAARFLSFMTGFLSLSQEILWMRMVSFSYAGAPQAFGIVLSVYLAGIAMGAFWGKRFCRTGSDLLRISGVVLLVAATLDLILPWLTATAFGFGRIAGMLAMAISVFLTSTGKSIIFPIAHHLGSEQNQAAVGSSVSKVYFANIAGSTLGPLVTGFFLLQVFSLQQCLLLMAGATFVVAVACLWRAGSLSVRLLAGVGAVLSLTLTVLLPSRLVPLLAQNTSSGASKVKQVVENRYGIIHVLHDPGGSDSVFGGNAYDGRINIDLTYDTNGINRLYALAAIKPNARRILNIGMSSGAWTRVLAAFPTAERIDVIEINPGYSDVIRQYSSVAPILDDPKIHIHYDDGRRWLKRNPTERYDLIVMNTTWHWRGYATLLLSSDFISELKSHMQADAVLAYNSTGSPDVLKTAAVHFSSVFLMDNFVVAGNEIRLPDGALASKRVAAVHMVGAPVLDSEMPFMRYFAENWNRMLVPFATLEGNFKRPLEVVTDQNMLTEFKYGRSVVGYLNRSR